jgi:CTP synthase (UTP-ammonia lyase)
VSIPPDFQSKPTDPHPLFKDFMKACQNYSDNKSKSKEILLA